VIVNTERKGVVMGFKRSIIGISLCLCFACGCGSTSPYRPYTYSSGYSDSPISRDVHEVLFVGTRYLNAMQVKYYATVRCAEIAQGRGKTYFEILKAESGVKLATSSTSGKTTIKEEASATASVSSVNSSKTTEIEERPAERVTYEIPTCKITFRLLDKETDECLGTATMMRDAEAKGVFPEER
jgi:hypothetical protein